VGFQVGEASTPQSLAHQVGRMWEPRKWTSALLESHEIETYERITHGTQFSELVAWGRPYLGAVTGNNRWFALNDAEVGRLGLSMDEVVSISPPGSRHLRKLWFGPQGLGGHETSWAQSPPLLFEG
jgi:adenine-specific DNA-methyltransferase